VKTFEGLSNADLADIYKYFKQATVGDINIGSRAIFFSKISVYLLGYSFVSPLPGCVPCADRPGMFSMDFTAKGKWDAWNSVKGAFLCSFSRPALVFSHALNAHCVFLDPFPGMGQEEARAKYIEKVNSLKK
jgi:acyl-CoA-binding protein